LHYSDNSEKVNIFQLFVHIIYFVIILYIFMIFVLRFCSQMWRM